MLSEFWKNQGKKDSIQGIMKHDNYNSVDLAKFIMAILVIAIHTSPFYSSIDNRLIFSAFHTVVHVAVPFFFIASGFFIGIKMNEPYCSQSNINLQINKIIHISKMYLIWSAVYIPLAIFFGYGAQGDFVSFVKWYIIEFFKSGSHFGNSVLWYLLSTIYALIYVLIMNLMKIKMHVVVLLGFVIGIVLQTLYDIHILEGFFYIPLGIYLSKNELGIKGSVCFLLVGMIGCFCSYYFGSRLLPVFFAIYAIGLFCLIIKINLKDSKIFYVLRKTSTTVFLIHVYIHTLLYSSMYGQVTFGKRMFVYTSMISIAVGLLVSIIKLKKPLDGIKKKFTANYESAT